MKKFVVAILIALVSVAGMFAIDFKIYAKKTINLDKTDIDNEKKAIQEVAKKWRDNDIEVIFTLGGFIDETNYEIVDTQNLKEYSMATFSYIIYSPRFDIHAIVSQAVNIDTQETVDINETKYLAGRPKIDFNSYKQIANLKF